MSLEEIRKGIDRVDAQMRELFIERMGIAEQVAQEKAKTEDAIYKPDREKIVIEKNAKDVDEHIAREYKAFLKRVMEVSRKYQYGRTLEMRNCFPYAFETEETPVHTVAVLKNESVQCAGENAESIVTADNYQQIAELIEEGKADAGAGVISKIGKGVSEDLNTMLQMKKLYINECLVETTDGNPVKLVRFSPHLLVRKADNRLRIAFVCPNRSGSIAGLLSMIADYGINMTEIHSIPYTEENGWNYRFFLELSCNLLEKDVQALIFQLYSETQEMVLLGSYACEGDF